MGPKHVRSLLFTYDEEATAVAFRKHTLPPLDAGPLSRHGGSTLKADIPLPTLLTPAAQKRRKDDD